MDAADSQNQWPPYSSGLGTQLYSWQAQAGMARFAAYIKKNSPLRAAYDAVADEIIEFIYHANFEPWYEQVYNKKIPYAETGSVFWNDKATHFITIAISMYQATRNEPDFSFNGKRINSEYFKPIIERGLALFKERLVRRDRGWVWDEGKWGDYRDSGEENAPDTSHANREAMMMVLGREAGFAITESDLETLGNTLGELIWNGSVDSPLFANYINGSNKSYRGGGAWTNGTVYLGWALLGRYSDSAFDAIEAILNVVRSGGGTLGGNASSHGKVSLAGHHLRNTCL